MNRYEFNRAGFKMLGGVMIKSILVPVDGSEHSDKALTLAVDIAEKYDADLLVLFVVFRIIVRFAINRLQRCPSAAKGLVEFHQVGSHGAAADGQFIL